MVDVVVDVNDVVVVVVHVTVVVLIVGVWSHTKVFLIFMSLQYGRKTGILWPEPFLLRQIFLLFILHASKIIPFIDYIFSFVSF